MTGKEILQAINELDDDLIEDAGSAELPKKGKRRGGKWLAVAAAVVFACVTGISVAAATTELGAKIKQFFSDPWESGYDVDLDMERVPAEVFDGNVTELKLTFQKQHANYKPYMSTTPGYYRREFASSQEVLAYLGWEELRYPVWSPEEKSVALTLYGDADGVLQTVSMEVQYEVDNVRIQIFSHVYTDRWRGSLSTGLRTNELETFTEEVFEAESGRKCLVITTGESRYGYYSKNAYLVVDNVCYTFHAAYRAGGERKAESLLKDWLKLW